MSTKKSGSKKNSEAMRELREKKDAEAKKKAGKVKGKKSPAPVKPAKPAKDKKPDKAAEQPLVLLTGKQLDEARATLKEVDAGISELGNALVNAVAWDKKLVDVREKQLWKAEYKSWTTYVEHIGEIAGAAKSRLFALIGFQKALPGLTAEERKQIGPRKGGKLTAAAKVAKSKGTVLPPEIVEGAKVQTQEQLESTIKDSGFSEPAPAPVDDRQIVIPGTEDLMANTQVNTLPYNPRIGGSGSVEGQHGTAQQFSAVVIESLEIVHEVYGRDDLTDMEAIEFALKEFRNSTCTAPGYEDMFNHQALNAVRTEAKKSKKASAK